MSVLQNAAVPRHLIDEIGVPADRIRHRPVPGTATIEDWLATEGDVPGCELVSGTLVERAMGLWESLVRRTGRRRFHGDAVAEVAKTFGGRLIATEHHAAESLGDFRYLTHPTKIV